MTRIVSGAARGHRLAVPATATRPTGDRVREALFSTLESLLRGSGPDDGRTRDGLVGARFLDLYAGSGAVALEALSRGAAQVLMVESDPRACSVLRRNAVAVATAVGPAAGQAWELRCRPVTRVLRESASDGVAAGAADHAPYDVVFADPPYAVGSDEVDDVLAMALRGGWVGEVVVVERAVRSPAPTWPAAADGSALVPWRAKRYGDTVVHYALLERS